MNGIETKNLSFSYNGKSVIEDVTFTVGVNETWAVIGRNGAGKSTLLKCLCGLLPVNKKHGSVFINGADIAKLSPRQIARQIAYVPQGINRCPPPFTVRKYLAMARFPYGGIWTAGLSSDDELSIDDALDLTDTARIAKRMMTTLSGGELQSALIAGAVAQGTPFLLLDEPTTYLDPCHRENVRMMIERVHTRRGVTVITVTHDVNFALATHDNVLALIDGKVFFYGTREKFCLDAEKNLSTVFSVDFRAIGCSGQKKFYHTVGEPA